MQWSLTFVVFCANVSACVDEKLSYMSMSLMSRTVQWSLTISLSWVNFGALIYERLRLLGMSICGCPMQRRYVQHRCSTTYN